MHRTALLALALAPIAVAAVVAAAPRSASACGGTFCDGGGPQVMPVDQSGETILFVMEEGWVEAHVQIDYEGDPAQFAWIVPIMAEPEVSVGSQELFDALLAATVPTFTLDTTSEGDCDDGPRNLGCQSFDAAASSDEGFIDQDTPPGAPNVLARDLVGAFEYAVLQGGTIDGIGQWLDDNGYARDDDAPEILQAYLDESFLFVAFKLAPGTGVDQIHPVVLRYQGTEPCIPLRLTRIAAVEDMKVRAFFLGDTRVVPTNYRHVQLNPLRIDWLGLGSNYDALVSEAIDLPGADGRAFVTEYAGPSSVVDRASLRKTAWDSEAFLEVTSATLTNTLEAQGLISCDFLTDPQTGSSVELCGLAHPLLLGLLRTYFPPLPDVPPEDFYLCTECYGLVDESTWDHAGFAAAFEEQLAGPADHAADVMLDNEYLTRLFTMISPGEMTSDPLFHERSDLGDVSNQWQATRVFHCEDNDRIQVPLSGPDQIYLDGNDQPPDFSELTAAVRIEEIPLSGAPMILLDTTEDDVAELEEWNDVHGPNNGGCDCHAPRRMHGAGWLGLLLLLGLRGRRGPTRTPRPRTSA